MSSPAPYKSDLKEEPKHLAMFSLWPNILKKQEQ